MNRSYLVFICLGLLSCFSQGHAAGVFTSAPGSPNPNQQYLFYLHGIQVELDGPDSWSSQFNKRYAYTNIVQEFVRRGFNVISEARLKNTPALPYATGIAGQVEQLLKAGVPGKNIAVIGHSKGAFMALLVRARVVHPDVSVVVMAGCALDGTTSVAGTNPIAGYKAFLNGRANEMKGRLLSIYDSSDTWFGTCQEAFGKSSDLKYQEIVLKTGAGHGVFYDANPAWVVPVIEWIGWASAASDKSISRAPIPEESP